jgi:hypothetical protein
VSARTALSLDKLLEEARRINGTDLETPLPDGEVIKTAGSAWKYQQDGKNWAGTKGVAQLSYEELMRLARPRSGGDAALLVALLRTQHAERGAPFAIVPRAMARDQVFPGWSEHRFRQALKVAVDCGFIERITAGGRYPGDPAQYRLI